MKGLGDAVKLLFKLKEDASEEERAHVLEFLEAHGAASLRPLFPGEKDAELGSMFVAELSGSGRTRILKALNAMKAVQFAEEEPTRKLIG
jgi:hypothetical protein